MTINTERKRVNLATSVNETWRQGTTVLIPIRENSFALVSIRQEFAWPFVKHGESRHMSLAWPLVRNYEVMCDMSIPT